MRHSYQCHRCHQSVDAQAVSCPYCRTPLKAYGHRAFPLHRAAGEEYAKAAYTTQTIPVLFLNVPMPENVRSTRTYSHQLGESAPQNQQPRDRCENWLSHQTCLATGAAVRKFFNRL